MKLDTFTACLNEYLRDELERRAREVVFIGRSVETRWQGGTYDLGAAIRRAREHEQWYRWQRAMGKFPIFIWELPENRPPERRWSQPTSAWP